MKTTVTSLLLSLLLTTFAAPAAAQNGMTTTKTASVLQPGTSPLVSFRILFMTGSASDPKGKEGVASLTAAMLAEGARAR